MPREEKMHKQTEFLKLAEDVSKCHLCAQMRTNPHSGCGECLLNDGHGLATDRPYVNLWNLWHGNLDAEIMVIGQDFGQVENADEFFEKQKSKNITNPTDVALRNLFKDAFDIDTDDENAPLFFTNMANCYRKNKTSGGMHSGWLPICANKFMARLISIVQPKMIIVLGQAAFDAMFCLDGMQIECMNPDKSADAAFKNVIKFDYQLKADNFTIPVFPVFHPGANANMNRNKKEQLQDWKRIANCYKKYK